MLNECELVSGSFLTPSKFVVILVSLRVKLFLQVCLLSVTNLDVLRG